MGLRIRFEYRRAAKDEKLFFRYLTLGFALFALASVDYSAILFPLNSVLGVVLLVARLLLVLAALRLAYIAYRYKNRVNFYKKNDHISSIQQVPVQAAENLQSVAGDSGLLTYFQAQVLAQALLKPRDFRLRVIETYDPDRRTLERTVRVEGQVPRSLMKGITFDHEPAPRILYPLMTPRKSKLVDHFIVKDASGCQISPISYRQSIQVAAVVLRLLLMAAFEKKVSRFKDAELMAIHLMTSRRFNDGHAPAPDNDVDLDREISFSALLNDDERNRSRVAVRMAQDFVRIFMYHYAIVVPIDIAPDGRFSVSYNETIVPLLHLTSLGLLNVLLGTRPITLTVSARGASYAQSWHLQVNGPDGTYLGDQRLVDSVFTINGGPANDESTPPHYRFRKRLGQPYLHLYTRHFPEPRRADDGVLENPRVQADYFEVPPGSLLRAMVSAGACLFLVWIIAIINSRVPDPGTDAPAVLLAFPAVVGAWLGFESSPRRLLEGTLAARISLIATVATSILASGLYLGHKGLPAGVGPGLYNWTHWPSNWSFFWVTDITWSILLVLSIFNFGVVSFLYIRRSALFTALSRRPMRDEVDAHQNG